jgi:hypothetical protein
MVCEEVADSISSCWKRNKDAWKQPKEFNASAIVHYLETGVFLLKDQDDIISLLSPTTTTSSHFNHSLVLPSIREVLSQRSESVPTRLKNNLSFETLSPSCSTSSFLNSSHLLLLLLLFLFLILHLIFLLLLLILLSLASLLVSS